MSTQRVDDRLQQMLRALPRILRSDRSPAGVLSEIAGTVREICGADYAFAALLDDNRAFGGLGSSGIPSELDELLIHHPALERIRTSLLGEDSTVRLSANTADVPAARTDPGRGPSPAAPLHSVMTFGEMTAVRLRAGVRTIGVIVLANRPGAGGFSPETEETLLALGRGLGAALDNSMLLREVLHARRWMRAATTLTQQLLGDEIDDPLREVSGRAMDLASADFAAVALVQGSHLQIHHVVGIRGGVDFENRLHPLPDNAEMQLLRAGETLVFANLAEHPSALLADLDPSALGPALVIPMIGGEVLTGLLLLGRSPDGGPFSHSNHDLASAFATQASIALELEAARQLQERLLLVEERDRIARDLHDHVVQRLFATGLSLNTVIPTLEGTSKDRVSDAMVAIDETIRQIRNTILTLRSAGDLAANLTDMISEIAGEAERLLGYTPMLALDPGTRSVTGPVAEDLAACVREALSNVVKHASSTQVIIKAAVHLGELELSVSDDGVGITSKRRSGLSNLAKRADQHGGHFQIDSMPGLGTTLTWRVPVSTV